MTDRKDDRMLQSFLEWARSEGLAIPRERATAALAIALSKPEGTDQDHRGVTLPHRHRGGGIITPQ